MRKPFIFHRIDDVGVDQWECNTLLDCLEETQTAYIVAIVPLQLSTSMAGRIRRLQHCKVVQHGLSHINHVGCGYPDEFPVSYGISSIRSQLLEGKKLIEDMLGLPVTGYTPPWNLTCPSTLVLLEELEYTWFSGHSRYHYFTFLRQLNVSVDPVLTYQPPEFRPVTYVENEVLRLTSKKIREIGIVHHPRLLDDAHLKGIMAWIRSGGPGSGWPENKLESMRTMIGTQ